MSNQNQRVEHLKKAGERLSLLSLEERYERVVALARQFLTAKANLGYSFPIEDATYEDAVALVMSWQSRQRVHSVVECLEWIINGTIRTLQPMPELQSVIPEEDFLWQEEDFSWQEEDFSRQEVAYY